MAKEKNIPKDLSFKKGIVQGAVIWFLGWLIFAVVEITFRMLGGPPLAGSIPLLMLALYAGLGFIAGVALGMVSIVLLKGIGRRVQHIELTSIFTASCITTVTLFYGAVVVNEKFLYTSSDAIRLWSTIGYILICIFLCVVLYLFFRRISDTAHHLSSFLALSLSIDVFMVGGFYVNENLLPGRFLTFLLRDIVINLGVFSSCSAIYFFLHTIFLFLGSRWNTVKNLLHLKKTVVGVIVLTIVVGGIWYSTSRSPLRKPGVVLQDKPNIILITMDTTRADHLSCYGYHRKTTPYLDEFAKESVLFKNAYSPSSRTCVYFYRYVPCKAWVEG